MPAQFCMFDSGPSVVTLEIIGSMYWFYPLVVRGDRFLSFTCRGPNSTHFYIWAMPFISAGAHFDLESLLGVCFPT